MRAPIGGHGYGNPPLCFRPNGTRNLFPPGNHRRLPGFDLWEVTSGLKEGEQVVDGANFLIDADSKITSSFSENK